MPVRYDQDTKAKAIRLVREHAGDYPSEYAAITAVARRLGMTPETLRKWIRQAAVDEGQAPGVSSEAAKEIRELGSKVSRVGADDRDLVGGGGFLRAGARPATPLICAFIDVHRDRFGVVPICRALSAQGVAIAPRTYWARRSRPPSRRALKDAALTEILAGIYEPDENGRRPPGVPVRQREDVGAPEPAGHHGREMHRGAADPGPWVARRHPRPHGAHHDR